MAKTPGNTAFAAQFPAADEAAWRALVVKTLNGADFERRLVSRSSDGIAIGPLYARQDGTGSTNDAAPGAAPFTRGFAASGSRGRWQIRQLCTDSDARQLEAAIEQDIAGGADAVTIRLAGPGQIGLPASELNGTLERLQGGQAYLEPGAAALKLETRKQLGKLAALGLDPVGTLARTGETVLLVADGSPRFDAEPTWLQPPATTLLADGRPFHEAGGSEAQELAGMLGALVVYLRAAEAGGLAPSMALPRIEFALAADADLFLTIAKLRAARRLVWRIAEASGAAASAGSLRLLATTSERMTTRRDPWVNMLRTTVATAAAAIGGADAIGVLPFTWSLGQPDSFARRIARNTHHVLAEESGLARVADPAGGAGSVERLTDELAKKAWANFQTWESRGGIVAGLRSGVVADEIGKIAAARAQSIAAGELALTGTSAFPLLGTDGVTVEPWPGAPACKGALLPPIRLAAPFERLRDAADTLGTKARVFLAALGPATEHAARTTWVTNLLATGGIMAITGDGFTSSIDAGQAFANSGAKIACLCGSDDAYGQLGEAVAGVLKQAGAQRVYLAGKPPDAAALRAADVDGFWFAGADMIALLAQLHRELS